MPVRPPAVAGTFYEGSADRLRRQVSACIAESPAPAARRPFIGAVVPHAGLMYSGHVAAAFYAAAELPKRFIILCPNHTGAGHFAAITCKRSTCSSGRSSGRRMTSSNFVGQPRSATL